MKIREHCPICGQSGMLTAHGVLAPFVATLIGAKLQTFSKLDKCDTCDFMFYSKAYDAKEEAALYGEYRAGKYLQVRKNWEPWYTSNVNDAFVPDSPHVDERVDFMSGILANSHLPQKLNVVVDVGGDEGQFFPRLEMNRKIVIDISDKPLRPETERIESLDHLDEKADLIIVAHLLEHLENPLKLLTDLKKHLSVGGHIYLEVPLDRPKLRAWHASERYEKYISKPRKKWTFIALDFLTGLARNFGYRIPKLGLVKESEHINYFSPTSLGAVAETGGFKIISHATEAKSKAGQFRLGKTGLLAQLI